MRRSAIVRCLRTPLLAAVLIAFAAAPAMGALRIAIDKSTQSMVVARDGRLLFHWRVSTGAPGYDTPSGAFTPFRMERDHFSKEWDDAPMPYSIFFTKLGHAIHGTPHRRAIGRPVSHGCVRLAPEHARILFELVQQEGLPNTRVLLTGDIADASDSATARRAVAIDPPGYGEVTFSPRPREAYELRRGYWVEESDGSRVFHGRLRSPAPLPPPPRFFFIPAPRFGRD